MSGRLLSLGVALGLTGVLVGAIVAACYEIPRPSCGFQCGPGSACPDGYTCSADLYCHGNGTPPDLVCTHPDAPLPVDAASDAPPDVADATVDTAADAAADAPDDAATDAEIDAAIDAAIDAP
ncbi:MAG TPA: hypothetical protein VHW23_17650 [Kofleriaceae bacterium]|nr:hypothetical protein [Kofleriaceae bacterium]